MSMIKTAVKIIQEALPNVIGIYAFGSAITPYQHKESDLDLAIFAETKVDPQKRWQLQETIASTLKRNVDLIDLKEASTVMRFQIISTSERVFCQDEQICNAFEGLIYSMYLRFNEERKAIIKDIQKRGSIYD